MSILFLLLIVLVGFSIPVQTAINSRLQHFLGSPLSASFVSFLVGMLAVWVVALFRLPQALPELGAIPWYAWTGGVTGLIGVTLYIVLFPRLGGIQTVLLPILGQIVMSMLIDSFGWFGMEAKPLSLNRLAGCLIATVGVGLAVIRKEASGRGGKAGSLIPWQLLGIFAGAMISTQSATNGSMGLHLGSPSLAAAVSFTISVVLFCFLMLFRKKERASMKLAFKLQMPWWVWMGGVIGTFVVIGFSAAAPVLGVGLMTIVSILGQLSSSVLIDRFGLMGAQKRPVMWIQYVGILVVFGGALMVYL